MANNKSAIKRWHQSLKRRDRNRATRSATRTTVRNVRDSLTAQGEVDAATSLSAAYSALDRAAKKGAIHKGKADRTKRRLAHLAAQATEATT